jgi:hypothetical protein
MCIPMPMLLVSLCGWIPCQKVISIVKTEYPSLALSLSLLFVDLASPLEKRGGGAARTDAAVRDAVTVYHVRVH